MANEIITRKRKDGHHVIFEDKTVAVLEKKPRKDDLEKAKKMLVARKRKNNKDKRDNKALAGLKTGKSRGTTSSK